MNDYNNTSYNEASGSASQEGYKTFLAVALVPATLQEVLEAPDGEERYKLNDDIDDIITSLGILGRTHNALSAQWDPILGQFSDEMSELGYTETLRNPRTLESFSVDIKLVPHLLSIETALRNTFMDLQAGDVDTLRAFRFEMNPNTPEPWMIRPLEEKEERFCSLGLEQLSMTTSQLGPTPPEEVVQQFGQWSQGRAMALIHVNNKYARTRRSTRRTDTSRPSVQIKRKRDQVGSTVESAPRRIRRSDWEPSQEVYVEDQDMTNWSEQY
ncbi:hypothetical protein M231_04083 [Tremella mesenterica]|uniref:Uncharacterized protein n=1 Tax=Tremella mesenterica TaxID=5217 RepID=A0A4V1M3Z4_TREME|nr:hypothetical protein M231_04083 [Tremella mesenterica]